MVYKICFVVTNGIRRRKFLWITRRTSGLYVAFAAPGGMHRSYHKDGKSHWKLNDKLLHDMDDLPPLDAVQGVVHVANGNFRLDDEALDRFELPEFNDEQIDHLVYLDNRRFGSVAYDVWIVEPWQHAHVPLIVDRPAHVHLSTHVQPWLAVVLYDM